MNYNIYTKFKKLQPRFEEVINGYHMLHKQSIKESIWEEINCNIVKHICEVTYESNGSHLSGKDNTFDAYNISNKTTKKYGKNLHISSYRLTKLCSNKNPGNPHQIINEIKKRDNSFDYYSLLIREELCNTKVQYEWYMIPKDHYLFQINYLLPKMNKTKNKIIGWKSPYCNIIFSMSSQLWYKFSIDQIKHYKLCYCTIDNNEYKIDYAQIYHMFRK